MTAIKVELELVDGSFTTRMLHAGETIEQFNRNVSRSSPALRRMAQDGQLVIRSMEKAQVAGAGFLSTLRDVSIVTTAVSIGFNKIINIQDTWVGAVVRTNAEFERLTHMLRSMSTAADPITDAANQVDLLVQKAKEAPFSLDSLTKSFTKLKATGSDPMKGSLDAITDGIAAFGGDGQSLERTVLGISQASGKGVLQMEELRQQIGESMPQAMGLMAASMGVSIATLVDHISTGRMAAGESLDLFYAELDRSFGGSARRMMQTFTGQMARTRTELQEFAQIIGGIDRATGNANEGGFFHTVTEQLRAFNELLASSGGQVFAQQVGQSLATVATWLQTAVEKAIEFRHAIGNMVELAAWVAGMKVAAAMLSSMSAGYTGVMRSLDMLKLKFAETTSVMALHQRALQNTAVSVASIDRAARLQAAVGMRALAGAAMSVVPAAGILGLAIYEIADAFDVFGSRGRGAIETLREFGNLAKDQLPNAQKDIEKRQLALTKEIQQINKEAKSSNYFGSDENKRAGIEADRQRLMEQADIAGRQAQIDRDRSLLRAAEIKSQEEDAQKAADFALRQLDRQAAADNRAYQVERERIQKQSDERIKNAETTGEKIDQIEKERAEQLLTNAQNLYKTQNEQLQNAVKELWAGNGVGPMPLAQQLQLDEFLKRMDSVREKQGNLRINGDMPDIGKSSSTEKDLERLQKLFDKTSDDVEGLTDKMNGANSELAEFQAKFARGAYGDTSVKQVQELGAQMELLLKKKAALDEINKGADAAQGDIESARLKLAEKRIELEEQARGRELTEGEKIRIKYEQGGYAGLGPNSPAQQALREAIQGMTMQGRVTDAVSVSMDKAFGQGTTSKIVTMNDVLRETLGIVSGIGQGVDGLDFSNVGKDVAALGTGGLNGPLKGMMGFTGIPSRGGNLMSSNMGMFGDPRTAGWKDQNLTSIQAANGMTTQVNKLAAASFKGFLDDLMAQGYKVSSLGGYALRNNVNANGRLSEHAFGNAIDINPAQNPNGKTLVTDMPANIRELAEKWNLAWGGDFKRMKDAMHFEWKGGQQAAGAQTRKVDMNQPFDINNPFAQRSSLDTSATYGEANVFLEKQLKLKEAIWAATDELTKTEEGLTAEQKKQAGEAKKTEMLRVIEETKESLDGLDKNYRAVSKLIAAGKFGSKDINTAENKELLRVAQELDAAEKSRSDRKQAAGGIESAELRIKEQELQLQREIEQLKLKAKDPNVRLESNGLVQLREQMDAYLADIETVYSRDSDQYRAGLEKKKQALAMFGQSELLQDMSNSNQKTRTMQQGLMNEQQARRAAMQQELAEVDAKIEYYRNAGMLDVEATAQFEAEKAAIRKKFAAQDPMSAQMRQWGDLQGNLQKQSAQWMDQLAGGVTDLIMGTGDLKQTLQSIARDVINMFVKKMMSGMMGNKMGGASGGKGAKGATGKATKGFPAAPVGLFHSGGIPGAGARTHRMVDPAMFKNARKFHSGANKFGGRRLLPGEMPAIVKKDEGIFTPEQMSALGSARGGNSQSISINAPVTVNASGGTPDQNADLAKQIGAEMEGTMRSVVIDEINRQMRPGNILSSGKGR